MEDLLKNEKFAAAYAKLGRVSLNPRRHTANDARAHSAAVADLAARLGSANGCPASEVAMLRNLGLAHDIGKITGTARPEKSLEVLAQCDVTDPEFLALVKWHDTSLPWRRSVGRGEAPSPRAWRKLTRAVDVRLLSIFMVADRVDAPGGWRRNAPTTWFLSEARARGLIGDLMLDVKDHPSEVCGGAALTRDTGEGSEILLIRTRAGGWELPKGGIEWDELPEEAAIRELREEAAFAGDLRVIARLGDLEYCVGRGPDRHLKRVSYYAIGAVGDLVSEELPKRTHDRKWVGPTETDTLPLVREDLRPLIRAAQAGGAR